MCVCVRFPQKIFLTEGVYQDTYKSTSQGEICCHTVRNVGTGGWQRSVSTLSCSTFYQSNDLKIMCWVPYRHSLNAFPHVWAVLSNTCSMSVVLLQNWLTSMTILHSRGKKKKKKRKSRPLFFCLNELSLFCQIYDRKHWDIHRDDNQKQRGWRTEKIFWEKSC